jgi:hypothetical protein
MQHDMRAHADAAAACIWLETRTKNFHHALIALSISYFHPCGWIRKVRQFFLPFSNSVYNLSFLKTGIDFSLLHIIHNIKCRFQNVLKIRY